MTNYRSYSTNYPDRAEIKIILSDLFQKKNWKEELDKLSYDKTDIIFAAADLAKEGKLDEALKVADYYRHDPDPLPDNDLDKMIIRGEDTRTIATARGALSWLLQAIVGKLDTSYYSKVLDILEELARDKSPYVRQQIAAPLEALVANIKAKKNTDGTIFNFGEENAERTENLAFTMLRENKEHPRILEYLTNVISRLRYLREARAMEVLNTFFYNKEVKLNPDYVTRRVIPLAIYFAEFRINENDGFKNQEFIEFLKKVIELSTSELKTTTIWWIWKTIKDKPESLENFKKYIDLLLNNEFDYECLPQLSFLVKTTINLYPEYAISLFERILKEFINRKINVSHDEKRVGWFYDLEEVMEKTAELHPEKLVNFYQELINLKNLGWYIGNLSRIYSSYEKAPIESQEQLKKSFDLIYSLEKEKKS
ncbi:MAG: hypothetical protein Q8R26_00280 [bacterium]|nr:hypothetical protein [bacterium]